MYRVRNRCVNALQQCGLSEEWRHFARVRRIEVCHGLPGGRHWTGPSRGRKRVIDGARGIRASRTAGRQRRGERVADASTACSHAAKWLLNVVRTRSSLSVIPRASKLTTPVRHRQQIERDLAASELLRDRLVALDVFREFPQPFKDSLAYGASHA
jgi:hypothetical protein